LKKGVRGFVTELWEMSLKKVPHGSNSSNFASRFFSKWIW
jgi:hypothetical protein